MAKTIAVCRKRTKDNDVNKNAALHTLYYETVTRNYLPIFISASQSARSDASEPGLFEIEQPNECKNKERKGKKKWQETAHSRVSPQQNPHCPINAGQSKQAPKQSTQTLREKAHSVRRAHARYWHLNRERQTLETGKKSAGASATNRHRASTAERESDARDLTTRPATKSALDGERSLRPNPSKGGRPCAARLF